MNNLGSPTFFPDIALTLHLRRAKSLLATRHFKGVGTFGPLEASGMNARPFMWLTPKGSHPRCIGTHAAPTFDFDSNWMPFGIQNVSIITGYRGWIDLRTSSSRGASSFNACLNNKQYRGIASSRV